MKTKIIVLLLAVLFLSCNQEEEVIKKNEVLSMVGYYQGEEDYADILNVRESVIIYRDVFIADSYLQKNDSLIFTVVNQDIESIGYAHGSSIDFKLRRNPVNNNLLGTKLRYDDTWVDKVREVTFVKVK